MRNSTGWIFFTVEKVKWASLQTKRKKRNMNLGLRIRRNAKLLLILSFLWLPLIILYLHGSSDDPKVSWNRGRFVLLNFIFITRCCNSRFHRAIRSLRHGKVQHSLSIAVATRQTASSVAAMRWSSRQADESKSFFFMFSCDDDELYEIEIARNARNSVKKQSEKSSQQ